ncbi:ABC transporter permease [Streptomyces sp. FB2]|uniref:ABC transporter permease n=1 Tax=Streptomyces sp. FB2 TaxID=2902454 RepID=UPI001F1DC2C3|nr:ABC transporter permease [Streptomyces sp. FB2]MCF2539425.1 ABC transporter permease [Streptomyces sp. FB2]
MERRGEGGPPAGAGARREQITLQFLIEAVLLGLFGGPAGAAPGVVAVLGYAAVQEWPAIVPPAWIVARPAVSVLAGTVAGLYPALRAGRMSPTGALRSA